MEELHRKVHLEGKMIKKITLSEGHKAKLIAPMDCQTQLCYMYVIHLEAVTITVKEIFYETVMSDLIVTLSKGQGAKLKPPVDCQPPFFYMSVIHLNAVTITVEEIYDETVMIDLIVTFSKGHRAKLTSPLEWQTPLCYMSVIHNIIEWQSHRCDHPHIYNI